MKKSNRAVAMSLALIGVAGIATGCGKKDEDSGAGATSQSKSSPGTAPASVKSSNGQPQQAPKQGPAAQKPD